MRGFRDFFIFLQDYRWHYGAFFLLNLCFIYSVVMRNFPIEIFLDTILFESFIGVIATAFTYQHWQKKRKLLEDFYEITTTSLPQTNEIEQNYARLVIRIKKENSMLTNDHLLKEQKILNYYAMWTHQLKVPLAVLELMAQTESLEVDSVKEELLKIEQYLDMMLQYLRFNTSTTDYQLVKIEVEPLVRETVKKYRSFFIQKNLTVEIKPLNLRIVTDQKWLIFVLSQVIFNAVKYTKKGILKVYANDFTLIIEDTGIGIASEDLPRIFEQGYTGYNGRVEKNHASGLGLFMVKQILNELGHKIEIRSTLGVGTQVRIDFCQR
ncbi:MAG: sensor histidine kinase [Streptococcaceae bacterium]|jgi:signal transduction histidine kinase|nr:sensor histidine kinase [Streptococcaceae bacterium]